MAANYGTIPTTTTTTICKQNVEALQKMTYCTSRHFRGTTTLCVKIARWVKLPSGWSTGTSMLVPPALTSAVRGNGGYSCDFEVAFCHQYSRCVFCPRERHLHGQARTRSIPKKPFLRCISCRSDLGPRLSEKCASLIWYSGGFAGVSRLRHVAKVLQAAEVGPSPGSISWSISHESIR